MSSLKHYPLGASVSNSPHSVTTCLPTIADVIGYEEKEPRVMQAMSAGYPRFLRHRWIEDLLNFYLDREGLTSPAAVLIPSRRASQKLVDRVDGKAQMLAVEDGLYMVYLNDSFDLDPNEMYRYIQHLGCGISSRQAEDLLHKYGLLESIYKEDSASGNAEVHVETKLALLLNCRKEDVLLCASGMNAFYAGFKAVQAAQQRRGRTRWLQLGWLYLDSGIILREHLGSEEILDIEYDISDMSKLEQKIQTYGDQLAAVVVECPSNPLIQICDLPRLARAVRSSGAILIVDPSVASILSINVLPYADVIVSSLTKYSAYEGDVMAGAVVVNPGSPFYGDLIVGISAAHTPLYTRDLARLANELEQAPSVVDRMHANADRLLQYLEQHEAVKRVYFANSSQWAQKNSTTKYAPCALLTIELKGSMTAFYDAVRCMKGPSFGTRFTLLSPFMYLAHYDLVTCPKGSDQLRQIGIDPDLIRISVGEEPYSDIESAIGEALICSLAS
ncbi:MAG: PLP-dependent transferase [Verrucomicrobiota bacterium]|nr:PLP-dependent transferase [Verrucomicrobiota bacterium]MEC8649512.1 PLP-dependent transferase [Verrucomicrobiota bacterium]